MKVVDIASLLISLREDCFDHHRREKCCSEKQQKFCLNNYLKKYLAL
jgi:hypothetical protein